MQTAACVPELQETENRKGSRQSTTQDTAALEVRTQALKALLAAARSLPAGQTAPANVPSSPSVSLGTRQTTASLQQALSAAQRATAALLLSAEPATCGADAALPDTCSSRLDEDNLAAQDLITVRLMCYFASSAFSQGADCAAPSANGCVAHCLSHSLSAGIQTRAQRASSQHPATAYSWSAARCRAAASAGSNGRPAGVSGSDQR